jgi:serine/tyrosine/threonine adenylyltransferase
MLEALGVNTSKSFALFETGEQLVRGDEPSPTRSAVLTRLSHGHIRIGTFQRQAFFKDSERSTGWSAIASSICTASSGGGRLPKTRSACSLGQRSAARLAASYMAAGFVHGVLNSDNINITGESFDYGPWRFTPYWDGDFTAAYFDHYGLYAFGRQPEAIHWDLAQLGGCLSLVSRRRPALRHLSRWGERSRAMVAKLLWRLGVEPRGDEFGCRACRRAGRALESRTVTIDRIFFDWRGGRDPGAGAYPAEPFRALAACSPAASASRPRILVRLRALLDAYRGGRGDLGRSPSRRLGAVRRQGSPRSAA